MLKNHELSKKLMHNLRWKIEAPNSHHHSTIAMASSSSSASFRIKPYESKSVTWDAMLQKNLQIPMNQREYAWTDVDLKKFMDDIIALFEEGKYIYKMGSIINLQYDGCNYIYDGQQRTLTIILFLYRLAMTEPKLELKIKTLLTVDNELDDLTYQQQLVKDAYGVKIIPKIYCVSPPDMKALVDIFNGKPATTSTVAGQEGSSKLYNAYDYITEYNKNRNYSEAQNVRLYKFVTSDIDIQMYDCIDINYVSRIFDWENNRGKRVESLDLIKNQILVKIGAEKRAELYDRWAELKNRKDTLQKINDYGEKVFDVGIQLYNNQVSRVCNHDELFKTIINAKDPYAEVCRFFGIVETLYAIMESISRDRFGRLLTNSCRLVKLAWEAYMWALLPIFYKRGSIDTRLIKLFVTWYFRTSYISGELTFNSMRYSNDFIRISDGYLKCDISDCNSKYDYYDEIMKCLVRNMSPHVRDDYEVKLREMELTKTDAQYLLLFLETCETPDLHTVPLKYTLEHIIPQKNKGNLTNPALMNSIGNVTLLEGKNTKDVQKGNSSLGCKEYVKKIDSYKNSSCKITREIAEKYVDAFTERDVQDRANSIAQRMNHHTSYHLW